MNGGRTKRIANGQEPIVVIPPVVKVVEVEVALAGIAPEFRNIAVAVAVLPDGNVQSVIYYTTL